MTARIYDNHTPHGRDVIDRAVLRKMGSLTWTRSTLATSLSMPERMVSDSLRRTVAVGEVERLLSTGKRARNGRIYRKVQS